MPFGLSVVAVKAIGIGLLVLTILGGAAWLVSHLEAVGQKREQDHVAALVAANAASTAAANARIEAQQKENDHEAEKFTALADAGHAHAIDAAAGLLDRFARAGAMSQGASAVATGETASAGAGRDVRTNVFGVVEQIAVRLAARCDKYRGAGDKAQSDYQALTPTP